LQDPSVNQAFKDFKVLQDQAETLDHRVKMVNKEIEEHRERLVMLVNPAPMDNLDRLVNKDLKVNRAHRGQLVVQDSRDPLDPLD
jgi:prefoldin subunit 5